MEYLNKLRNFLNGAQAPVQRQVQNFGNNLMNNVQQYQRQVQANKQTPFFNNTGNNPIQWLGKVGQDIKQRGPFEGLQDLTYPVLMNPYIEPLTEPITGAVRVANYKAGRPNPLLNNLLGQSNQQIQGKPFGYQQKLNGASKQIANTLGNRSNSINAIQDLTQKVLPNSPINSFLQGDLSQAAQRIGNKFEDFGKIQNQGIQAYQQTNSLPFKQSIAVRNADPRIKAMNEQSFNQVAGMISGPMKNLKKEQIELVRNSFNSKIRDKIGQWAVQVESGKLNKADPLNDYVYSLGESVFGKDAAYLSPKQLLNALDVAQQEAGKLKGARKLNIGLSTGNVREGAKGAQAGLYDTKPNISFTKSPDGSTDLGKITLSKNNEELGFVDVFVNRKDKTATIPQIYVNEANRNKGLGRSLYKNAEEEARKRGAKSMIAEDVRDTAFWEKMGYQMYEDGNMVKILDNPRVAQQPQASAGLYDVSKTSLKDFEDGIYNAVNGSGNKYYEDIYYNVIRKPENANKSIKQVYNELVNTRKGDSLRVKTSLTNENLGSQPSSPANPRVAEQPIADIPNVFKEVAKKSKSIEEFNYRIKDMYQSGNHIDSFAKLDEKNGMQQLNNFFKETKTIQTPLKSPQFQPKPQGSVPQAVNNASNEANPLISNVQDIAQLQGQPQSKKQLFQRQPDIPKQAPNQADSLDNIIAQGREEISSGKPKIDKRTIKEFGEDVYTSWVDRFYPITKVAGNVEKSLKTQGSALRPEYNPTYTIKKFLGAGGIAENRIENEFKPILNMADKLKMSKDDFDLYLINRRKVGFGEIDREIYGSDPVKAKAIKDALEAKYGQQSEEIATKFYNYRGKLFDELVDAGFIAKDKAPVIKKQNPDYAPFYREMETELDNYLGVPSSKLQQAKNPLNKIEGSTKKILSPVESTIADTIRYRAAIEKNNVAKSIVGLQKAMPELNFEKVSQSSPDTITVWENGQKNYYKVGRDIADTVKGLNEEQMNSILKVLSIPSSILRQGATGRNPAFMIPNMVRDQLDAAINSKYGYVPFLDYARGLSHLLKKDEVYQRWQKSGSQIALSELSGRKSINAMFDEKKGKKKFFDWVTKGLDVAGKYSEQPTRLGLFSKGLKKTGNDLFANMESREGTLDFARMGSKMKTANSLIPFLNVGVQGFDKMIRTAKANPARFTALMGIYGATPTIATSLWNIQNFPEEYKEIPQWEKNTNFIIVTGRNEKGTVDYISIPKGNVIQYISNPIENFISYAADTNSQTVQQMATQFISSGLPVIGDGSTVQEVATKTIGQNLPQAIKPATENLLNKSFFKYNTKKDEAREIVPYYLKDKAPGDQSYDYTPSAYKTIGKAINVSPLLVQNFLEGTFAGYVKEPLGIYETFKSIADGEEVDKNKAFILRRFLKETYPTSDTKSNGGSLIKREVAQAPESSMISGADASGFKNPFKKKEQPKDAGKITEVSWESEAGRKTTIKLNEKPKQKTGIDAFNKENTELLNARKVFNAPSDQVTSGQKAEIFKQLGFTKEQLEYDHKASGTFNTDERIDYILSKSPNHDKLINNLTTGRENSVAGNKFATDTVINKLRDLGEISKDEANKLKAINSGKKAVTSGKKAKKVTFAKIKAVKIASTRKTTKTTFKAPKVAKPKVEKIVFKKKKK